MTENNECQCLTANHGSQPVSGCLEKLLEKETSESLKTILQVGGCEPYLQNVVRHAGDDSCFENPMY